MGYGVAPDESLDEMVFAADVKSYEARTWELPDGLVTPVNSAGNHDDLMAAPRERPGKMASYEPCPACNGDPHGCSSPAADLRFPRPSRQ
jgi:hypothetical protein